MSRKLISSGSKFETEMAYSRAVVDGDWIFVSGTTGFNYATMEISEDVAAQAEQTFLNIKAAMEKAGFGLEHIVRVHYILPKPEEFPGLLARIAEISRRNPPGGHHVCGRTGRSPHEDRN